MKFEQKFALGAMIIALIITLIVIINYNKKNKDSRTNSLFSVSTDPVIDNKPLTIYPLGLPPNFNGGVYTISGKDGYYGYIPSDYNSDFKDTRINDTTDPRWTGLGKYSLAFNPAINAIDYTTNMTNFVQMSSSRKPSKRA